MLIIETSVFTKQITRLLSEDSYCLLQQWIVQLPERGELIRGSGGCRKIRWRATSRGKRGGIRVIYYWVTEQDQILMLLAYAKNESEDLSNQQMRQLADLVKMELRSRNETTTI